MNRISSVRCSLSLLLASTLLGGCSWFHHRDDYYAKAAETRPLVVPPDLDTPVGSNELVVPAADAAGSGGVPATAPPAGVAATTAPAPGASSTVVSGGGLRVADSLEHTWQRVGLALERAQVGTISSRDAAAHSYSVEVAGLTAAVAPAPVEEHHWYTRILHPFGGGSSSAKSSSSAPVSGSVNVKVSAEGDAARVEVEGAGSDANSSEAARRVLAVLRDRLS